MNESKSRLKNYPVARSDSNPETEKQAV